MGFIGVIGLPITLNIDIRQVAWMLILLSLHFFVNDNPFSITKILLVVSLGCLGLTKFTGMIMATGVILLIAVDEVLRHRRFPWIVFIFAGSVLCFWMAAGQRLDSFLPFFSNSWQLTSGYTEAMMWEGNREKWAASLFLLAAVAAALPAVYTGFAKHRHFGILPAGGVGFILLMVFKHSFVRYDDHHEIVAAPTVLLIAFMSLAVSWPFLRNKGPKIIVMDLLLLDGALVYAAVLFNLCTPGEKFLEQFAETLGPHSILSPARLLYDPDALQARYENRLAAIREKYPLPELSGDVDVYPWNQMVVFANGLHYHPRPIFQSYSAYTPKLAELNAAYLRDGHAAENILFSVGTIDGRFPSLDDGYSWPELLTRYDIYTNTEYFVVLKRSPAPRKYHLALIQKVPIHFGETVELPATTNVSIWAEIKISQTPWWGSVIPLFYKPAILKLAVFMRNGQRLDFRLIPGMARIGFLLSPLIKDNMSFLSLVFAGGEHNLAGLEVTSITVLADTKSGSTLCYKSPMLLSLYRLDFPRQNPDEPEPGKELHRTPQVSQNLTLK